MAGGRGTRVRGQRQGGVRDLGFGGKMVGKKGI